MCSNGFTSALRALLIVVAPTANGQSWGNEHLHKGRTGIGLLNRIVVPLLSLLII